MGEEIKASTEAMEKLTMEIGPEKNGSQNGAAPPPTYDASTFQEQFKAFSKFGDIKSDGKTMTLSQSDKWMKQAKVIDGKRITSTDTGIYFKKLKSLKLPMSDYLKFLEELAKAKNIEVQEIKAKLANSGQPGVASNVTGSKASDTVKRLTDTSRYTGTHKQRFDEGGKGKGMAGRKDDADTSGYVSGYHNKDTYTKKH